MSEGLVSCSSGSEQTVTSDEELRALSEHTTPVPSSWDVCSWIHPKSSLSLEPMSKIGSSLPYTALSGVLSLVL